MSDLQVVSPQNLPDMNPVAQEVIADMISGYWDSSSKDVAKIELPDGRTATVGIMVTADEP